MITDPGIDNQIGWDGYIFNREMIQYAVRFRCYDPVLGRWLERDPFEYEDAMSLYEYGASMPLVALDPMGLSWQQCRSSCRAGCRQEHPGFGGSAARWACYAKCDLGCAAGRIVGPTIGAAIVVRNTWDKFKRYACRRINLGVDSALVRCACGLIGAADIAIPIPIFDAIDCGCNISNTLQLACNRGLSGAAIHAALTAVDCTSFNVAALIAVGTQNPLALLLDTSSDLITGALKDLITQGTPFPVSQFEGCCEVLDWIFPPVPRVPSGPSNPVIEAAPCSDCDA